MQKGSFCFFIQLRLEPFCFHLYIQIHKNNLLINLYTFKLIWVIAMVIK